VEAGGGTRRSQDAQEANGQHGVGDLGVHVATGVFGARMAVELENDGPVTIVL